MCRFITLERRDIRKGVCPVLIQRKTRDGLSRLLSNDFSPIVGPVHLVRALLLAARFAETSQVRFLALSGASFPLNAPTGRTWCVDVERIRRAIKWCGQSHAIFLLVAVLNGVLSTTIDPSQLFNPMRRERFLQI